MDAGRGRGEAGYKRERLKCRLLLILLSSIFAIMVGTRPSAKLYSPILYSYDNLPLNLTNSITDSI